MSLLQRSVGLLNREHIAESPAIYKPPAGNPFDWPVIVGMPRGGEMMETSGDIVKVFRRSVQGSYDALVANGVTAIQRNAKVLIEGEDWQIEVQTSNFRSPLVQLGLIRKIITRHEELESHVTV